MTELNNSAINEVTTTRHKDEVQEKRQWLLFLLSDKYDNEEVDNSHIRIFLPEENRVWMNELLNETFTITHYDNNNLRYDIDMNFICVDDESNTYKHIDCYIFRITSMKKVEIQS